MREKRIKERLVLKKTIKKKLNQLQLIIIIVLIGMIITKKNPETKQKIKEVLHHSNITKIQLKNLYQKYFGSIFLLSEKPKEVKPVFQENTIFENKKKYKDGVEIKVKEKESIPAIESGIIVYIGEKEDYGHTIIVEQVDGIDTFYSNIELKDKKLYDYIEKGEILGEAKDNKIYLVFQKDGVFLEYEKYI